MNQLALNAGGFHYPDILLPSDRPQVAPQAMKNGSPYKNQGPLEPPCRNRVLTRRNRRAEIPRKEGFFYSSRTWILFPVWERSNFQQTIEAGTAGLSPGVKGCAGRCSLRSA
jgi:hypothetical protein